MTYKIILLKIKQIRKGGILGKMMFLALSIIALAANIFLIFYFQSARVVYEVFSTLFFILFGLFVGCIGYVFYLPAKLEEELEGKK